MILTCFIVFIAKVCEKSVQSLSQIFMVKNMKLAAAACALTECAIWGIWVSAMIDDLSSFPALLIAYCLGYALGVFMGSLIEEKLALGTMVARIYTEESYKESVISHLKEMHQGFTVFEGTGGLGDKRYMITVAMAKKDTKGFVGKIKKLTQDNAFIIMSPADIGNGGYGLKRYGHKK